MLLRRGYRFKLKMTEELDCALTMTTEHARFVWNKALGLNMARLEHGLPIMWYADLSGLLRLWKESEEYGFLAATNAQVLQQKLRDLALAFSDAFDSRQPGKRMPRFKKHDCTVSVRWPQAVRVDNRRIRLPKIGWVRFFKSRAIPGIVKSATVSREADGWYISLLSEVEIPDPAPHSGSAVGVDRGIVVFAANSDGELVKPLNAPAQGMKRIARLQRNLARDEKGSKNRRKAADRIARLHQQIAHQRHDHLHKLSTRWTKSYALIALEDLRIVPMMRSARSAGLKRAILNQGWGAFAAMLDYKAQECGGRLIFVPPHFSSQECSNCGFIAADNRETRDRFRCGRCGHTEHADVNAAKNILARAKTREGP